MKKATITLCLLILMTGPAWPQWTPQADSIFGSNFLVSTLQAINTEEVWAGVHAGTAPYVSLPTLYPWIIRSFDSGNNWSYDTIPGSKGYAIGGLASIGVNQRWASLRYAKDTTLNRLFYSNDAGESWQLKLEDRTAGGFVHFFNAQEGVVIHRNTYRTTSDGGETWSSENLTGLPSITHEESYLLSAKLKAVYEDTIWLTSVTQQLAKSTDRGHTWNLINLPLLAEDEILSMISFSDGAKGMAASLVLSTYTTRMFTTTDGGLSWQEVTQPQPLADALAQLEAVEAIPGQPGWYVVQCTDYNINIAQTWLTQNDGASWELKNETEALNYAGFALDFISKEHGWVGLSYFNANAPSVYHWTTPLGLVPPVEQVKSNLGKGLQNATAQKRSPAYRNAGINLPELPGSSN